VLASQYRYLRCGNTGWDLNDDTRMAVQSNNTYTIEYDVTNLNDSCVITHTNELNGWGTKSGDYKIVFDGGTFEPGEEATLTWEGDYPTHLQINYPTAGRYRLRFQPTLSVGMQNKIGIYRVD
jgi:hypothetical protein